jgi:hemoglobin-like flavoprotein
MRDISLRTLPIRPSNILQTPLYDPPPHVSNKKNHNKNRGLTQQSELLSQINTKDVVLEIFNTEIPLTLQKLLGASKEISNDLQEHLHPWNKAVATYGY